MLFRYKSALICFFFVGRLAAQQELMLSSMTDLWHSNSVNPAFYPKDKRIYIGLPAYSVDLAHSGDITFQDIFRKDGDRNIIDLDNAIAKLEPENEMFLDQRIETVSIGLRSRNDKWGLQFSHANVTTGWVQYPKALAEFLWNGNGPYVGETLEIGPKADIFDWNEWSVGLSRRFGKVNFAARFKYLTGAGYLRSDENRTLVSIYTDPDIYQLTLKTDYVFYSSSIVDAVDTSAYGYDFSTRGFGGKSSTENSGYAIDLGFDAQLSDMLSVHVSAVNLGGSIRWKKDAATYTSKNEYLYEGAVIPGIDIINGADSLDFDSQIDTLNDIFKFVKTEGGELTNELPLRIYGGANLKLSEKWSLGFNAMYQTHYERVNLALGVSARWQPLKWLALGGMYSANSRSVANIGLQVVFKPGPVQLYVASDNVLNGFSVKSSPGVNLRAGASLLF